MNNEGSARPGPAPERPASGPECACPAAPRYRRPSNLARYGVAVASVVVALGVVVLSAGVLHDPPLFVFILAVLGSAAFGGLGPGVLATALAAGADVLVAHGVYDYDVSFVRIALFLVAGLMVGMLERRTWRAWDDAEARAAESAALSARLEREAAERAQLLRAEQDARIRAEAAEQRLAYLGHATLELTRAVRQGTVIETLCDLVVPRLADWCIVRSAAGNAAPLRVAHRDAAWSVELAAFARALDRLGPRSPLPDALHVGRSVLRLGEPPAPLPGPEALWPHAWISVPIHVEGEVAGSLALAAVGARGFSERDLEMVEELARRAGAALENALLVEASRGADRAKADFLAVMSHELRTPLTAVIGYTDILHTAIAGPITDVQRQYLQRIAASAWQLLELIDEVLSFAKLEAGVAEKRIDEVSLAELVHEASKGVVQVAAEKRLTLRLDAPDTRVAVDAGKVYQILCILLSNAVKFTDEGEVHLDAEVADGVVVFQVRDTGPGIEERDLERIFQPFTQLESANIRRIGGAGLGLTVARRLALLHDGELAAESVPGAGSVFTLRLPLHASVCAPDPR